MKIERKKLMTLSGNEKDVVEFTFRNEDEWDVVRMFLPAAADDATTDPATPSEILEGTAYVDQTYEEFREIGWQLQKKLQYLNELPDKVDRPISVTLDPELVEPFLSILITVCVKEYIRMEREHSSDKNELAKEYEIAKRLNETHFIDWDDSDTKRCVERNREHWEKHYPKNDDDGKETTETNEN